MSCVTFNLTRHNSNLVLKPLIGRLSQGYLAYKDMEVVGIKVIRRWFVCVFVVVVVRNVVEVFL